MARKSQEVIVMKGRRHSPEQVVRKLREADRLQAEGADVDAVGRLGAGPRLLVQRSVSLLYL